MSAGKIGFAETGSGRLAHRTDGSGPPLVLAQRFRGTMDDWDPAFIGALAATGHSVIRFDSAGVGRSSGTTPNTLSAAADILVELLDALDLDVVDLLGWSMGGEIAQWVGLRHPERVRRLVLAATSPGQVTEASADPRVPDHAGGATVTPEDELFLFFHDGTDSTALGKRSIARTGAERTSPPVAPESVEAQSAASAAYQRGDDAVRPRLAELRMPILVANGVHDRMLPAIGSFIIASAAPDAKLVLYPDAGHGFLFQQIDGFVGEVQRFLDADEDPTWT